MLRVGLTGGIACGKSHVLRRFEGRGLLTLDLDLVAHQVMAHGGAAYAEVVDAFGSGILGSDGQIDRKALGAIVFADVAARERLNAIVHPHVRREEAERLAGQADGGLAVTDAALLVETGFHLRFDRLVVVHCAPEAQLRRLTERDSLTMAEAQARIAAQMPLAEKRQFAHFEIDTSGPPEDTDRASDRLADALAVLARRPAPALPLPEPGLWALLGAGSGGPDQRAALVRLLDDVARANGLQLSRLGELLGRARGRGWLASEDVTPLHPAGLVAPVVAWCLARRGVDDDLLGLAVLSFARALTPDRSRWAETCAAAWWIAHRTAADAEASADAARAFARRWARHEPSGAAAAGASVAAVATAAAATREGWPAETASALARFAAASLAWAAGGP